MFLSLGGVPLPALSADNVDDINAKLQALEDPKNPINNELKLIEQFINDRKLKPSEDDLKKIYEESQLFVDMPFDNFLKVFTQSYVVTLASRGKREFILNGSPFRVTKVVRKLAEDKRLEGAVEFVRPKIDAPTLDKVWLVVVEPPAGKKYRSFFEHGFYYWRHDPSIEVYAVFSFNEKQGPKVGGVLGVDGLRDLRADHLRKVFGNEDVILMSRKMYEDVTPDGVEWRNGTLAYLLGQYRQSAAIVRGEPWANVSEVTEDFRAALKEDVLTRGWAPYKEEAAFAKKISDGVKATGMEETKLRNEVDRAYAAAVEKEIKRAFETYRWRSRLDEAAYYKKRGFDQKRYFEFVNSFVGWVQPPDVDLRINNALDSDGGGLSSTTIRVPGPYLEGDSAWSAYETIVTHGEP